MRIEGALQLKGRQNRKYSNKKDKVAQAVQQVVRAFVPKVWFSKAQGTQVTYLKTFLLVWGVNRSPLPERMVESSSCVVCADQIVTLT